MVGSCTPSKEMHAEGSSRQAPKTFGKFRANFKEPVGRGRPISLAVASHVANRKIRFQTSIVPMRLSSKKVFIRPLLPGNHERLAARNPVDLVLRLAEHHRIAHFRPAGIFSSFCSGSYSDATIATKPAQQVPIPNAEILVDEYRCHGNHSCFLFFVIRPSASVVLCAGSGYRFKWFRSCAMV